MSTKEFRKLLKNKKCKMCKAKPTSLLGTNCYCSNCFKIQKPIYLKLIKGGRK